MSMNERTAPYLNHETENASVCGIGPSASPPTSWVSQDASTPCRGRIESTEWFRAVFEGSRDAIFIVDEAARYVDANTAAEELTGYTREEMRRLTIPDMHNMAELPQYPECFHRIMRGEPRNRRRGF